MAQKKITPKEKIIQKIREFTGHKYVFLTGRCNMAIFDALFAIRNLTDESKSAVLTVDQGGWSSYYKIPKHFGLDIVEIKTDYGIVNSNFLELLLKKNSMFGSFLMPACPAYSAKQDSIKIQEICTANDVFLINDISGVFGEEELVSYNSDIYACSFGVGKMVEFGYGGFVSTNNPLVSEQIKRVTYLDKICEHKTIMKKLYDGVCFAPSRVKLLKKLSAKVKSDLSLHYLLHGDADGINVLACYVDDLEKEKIIDYCKNNNLQYVVCPNKIKVMTLAVCIEVKKKTTKELQEEGFNI